MVKIIKYERGNKIKMKITRKEFDAVRKEIEDLMYENPKTDFEHIWNCALDKADECFNGFEEED